MFFGLFSTHLPFVLVGVIYFLSFALASLNAFSSAANQDASLNATSPTAYNSPQNISAQTLDLPYLLDIPVDMVSFDTHTNPVPNAVISRVLIPDQPHVKYQVFQKHFARPPPHLT